jgi:hypothetical protein
MPNTNRRGKPGDFRPWNEVAGSPRNRRRGNKSPAIAIAPVATAGMVQTQRAELGIGQGAVAQVAIASFANTGSRAGWLRNRLPA